MAKDKHFTVYMLAPVNVRVRARTAEEAKKRAEKAVNDARSPQALTTDDAEAVYLDDGTPYEFDRVHPEPVEFDMDESLPVVNPIKRRAR